MGVKILSVITYIWPKMDSMLNYHEQALINTCFFLLLQLYCMHWSLAKSICDNKALANLAKISNTQIKVWLQFDYISPIMFNDVWM